MRVWPVTTLPQSNLPSHKLNLNSTWTVNTQAQHSVVLKLKPGGEEMLVRLQSVPKESPSDGSHGSTGMLNGKQFSRARQQVTAQCQLSYFTANFHTLPDFRGGDLKFPGGNPPGYMPRIISGRGVVKGGKGRGSCAPTQIFRKSALVTCIRYIFIPFILWRVNHPHPENDKLPWMSDPWFLTQTRQMTNILLTYGSHMMRSKT